MVCPNIKSKEWINLSNTHGINSYLLWDKYNGYVPIQYNDKNSKESKDLIAKSSLSDISKYYKVSISDNLSFDGNTLSLDRNKLLTYNTNEISDTVNSFVKWNNSQDKALELPKLKYVELPADKQLFALYKELTKITEKPKSDSKVYKNDYSVASKMPDTSTFEVNSIFESYNDNYANITKVRTYFPKETISNKLYEFYPESIKQFYVKDTSNKYILVDKESAMSKLIEENQDFGIIEDKDSNEKILVNPLRDLSKEHIKMVNDKLIEKYSNKNMHLYQLSQLGDYVIKFMSAGEISDIQNGMMIAMNEEKGMYALLATTEKVKSNSKIDINC